MTVSTKAASADCCPSKNFTHKKTTLESIDDQKPNETGDTLMFRIEAFCDDKMLPRVLHAMAGLILGQPKIQPVSNAHAKNGQVKANSNGDLLALFETHVKRHHLTTVTAKQMKAFAVEHGYSEKSYSHILSKMREAKHLRKKQGTKGQATVYIVTVGGAK
jgi:hypothetical protein